MVNSTGHSNLDVFFELLRAGLWETDARLRPYESISFKEVYKIAKDQSVIGLITAGLEHVADMEVSDPDSLSFVYGALSLEQRNIAMNRFICDLMVKFEKEGIEALLVKGQGIAQCYERPLWRASGDVDLLLDKKNYDRAKVVLGAIADRHGEELLDRFHIDFTIGKWEVELHGSMRNGLWKRMNMAIDAAQASAFCSYKDRIWLNGGVAVALPSVDDDVIFVFTHILQHFFNGGIGLRQICDWCRLLYKYRNDIDLDLLRTRLRYYRLFSEWKAFAALAVYWLGMDKSIIPFYSTARCWRKKSDKIIALILEDGNFGQNRDDSYYQKYPFFIIKVISLWRFTWDSMRYCLIFPVDALKVWVSKFSRGVKSVAKGQ